MNRMVLLLDTLDAALAAQQGLPDCWVELAAPVRRLALAGAACLTGGQALIRLNEPTAQPNKVVFFPAHRRTDAQVSFILRWVEMEWHKRFMQQAGWTSELRHYLFERTGMQVASGS